MSDMTIEEFCERHNACYYGMALALANCRDMNHAWDTLRPECLIWVSTRPGVLDVRTLKYFAVWCALQVHYLMDDQRSVDAINVAVRYLNNQATDNEMIVACGKAWAAASCAASSAAWASTWTTSLALARDVTKGGAEDAAWNAAWNAAMAADFHAARSTQAEWLRQNAKPNFGGAL